MKLLKYDKFRGVNGMSITAITNAVTNNVSSNIFGNGGSNNSSHTDRTIWGQYDEGDDLDGSMTVNGNITIKAIVARSYDPDDDEDDGEEIEEEEGGGNLSVEGSIEAFDIDIKNAYARNHLYVNYPHPNGTKQCVVDLIKNNADNINTNKTNITNLTNTVNALNSTITELNSTIITLSNRIKTLESNQCKCDGLTEARVIELIKQYAGNSGSGSGSETPDPPTSNYRIVVYVHNAGDNISVNAYLFDSNEEPVLDDYDNRYTALTKVEDAAGVSTIVFNQLIPQSPLSLDVNTRGGVMKTIGRNEDFKVYLKVNGLWYNAGEFTLEAHKSYPVNHTLYG